LRTWSLAPNDTFGNILYDLYSPTSGWVYTVVRSINGTSAVTYNLLGLNPNTSALFVVKEYVPTNAPFWTCLEDGGFTIDDKGWISYFIITYDNDVVGTLIWNYNVISNQQNFVTLNQTESWYTQGFQYSPVLKKHVAIGGRNAVNYQYLSIVTYVAGDPQLTRLCDFDLSKLPISCIGQSFLGSAGSDIYMIDCYSQALTRFDFKCNLLSSIQVPNTTVSGPLSLINAPFAVYRN